MKNLTEVSNAELLKALANARRLDILVNLQKGELSVGALEKLVGLSQSALSQHLAVLRKTGIVKTRRDAQTIYYRLENPLAKDILKLLKL